MRRTREVNWMCYPIVTLVVLLLLLTRFSNLSAVFKLQEMERWESVLGEAFQAYKRAGGQ